MERNVVPAAAELGVGFVPYSPLGRGFLTGTVDASTLGSNDFRRNIPRFAEDAAAANQGVVAAVRAVAAELTAAGNAATPAQVALAWLLVAGRPAGAAGGPHPRHPQGGPDRREPRRPDARLHRRATEALDAAADAVVGSRSADPNWVSQGRE